MRRARLVYVVTSMLFAVPRVFAQAPTSDEGDDLDVTMRVIVVPNAKVPDEIVRKIPLPKPTQPAATGKPDEKPKDGGKPDDSGKPTDGGKPTDSGKPTDTGKPADTGKPKDTGKPTDTGKPKDTGKPPDAGKPKDPGKPPGAGNPNPPGRSSQAAPDVREQGRAFGQQVSEEAKERSEDARRNGPPEKPPKPPKTPKPPR
jgi:hypothetical protein